MRHRKMDKKFGRTSSHRKAMIARLVCNLIEARRVETTLPKAREARRVAEKMVTMARKGTIAARRNVISRLGKRRHVTTLFDEIAPQFEGRNGGYTRIVKSGRRVGDGAEMAYLEWVGVTVPDRTRKKKSE